MRSGKGDGDKLKVSFWNVGGLKNKEEGFWEGIKGWDIVFFCETWVDEKDWGKVKRRLPKGYRWRMQPATKEHKKGRKAGGMVSGVRMGIKEEATMLKDAEGCIARCIRVGREKWNFVGVYRRRGEESGWQRVEEWMEEGKDELVLIGGDFNAWTGELGGGDWNEEEEKFERTSRHKEVDKEGRKLIKLIEERGWVICNGNTRGDERGEFTFSGKGDTVIDYLLAAEGTKSKIKKMMVGCETDLEHFPIIAEIEGQWRNEKERRREERKGEQKTKMGKWGVSQLLEFEKEMQEDGEELMEEEDVNMRIERLKRRIEKVKVKIGQKKNEEEDKHRGWWDEECERSRRLMREYIKEWRKGVLGKKEYNKLHKEHEKLVRRKREEEKERYNKEVEKAVSEGREWEVINRERGNRKDINREIGMREWTDYFKRMGGGVNNRIRGEGRKFIKENDIEEVRREEVEKAIARLKRGKAAGHDEIEGEALKFGGEKVRKEMWEIVRRVWRGEGWPEDWKTGLIVPLVKKGVGKSVEEYRGITLMPIGYKVYAEVLRGRLEKEVEKTGGIPHNQTGFRTGMGTMDNIYTLNYIVNKNLGKKGGKLIALFVDFKAAFPSVNRGLLWRVLERRGIEEGVIERVKELYTDVRSRVKVGGKVGKEFWLGRGLMQGCPLSPLLFTLLIADLEEKMKKRGKGGVVLGKGRVYSLAYADDVVLMADDEAGMRLMMGEFEKYAREKDLWVNVEKTKIVRFRKRRGKRRYERSLNKREVEEVNEFCYLGFWFDCNGTHDLNVKRRVERASRVMGQVWGIGVRRFRDDWKRRVWLFDVLIWSIASYGVEVWGWKEEKKVESMHERFLRWVMGVSMYCPGYMLREELEREKMVVRQRKRAWRFEEKLRQGGGSEWARMCLGKIEEREVRGAKEMMKWEKMRRKARKDMGKNGIGEGEMELKLKKKDKEERWEKIVMSKYNRWYKMVKKEGIPRYLTRRWKECKWKRVLRFRMGEGMSECRYWLNEEEKMCRVCGGELEDWEHVIDRCERKEEELIGMDERVRWILDDCGQGEEWMRGLEEKRKINKSILI